MKNCNRSFKHVILRCNGNSFSSVSFFLLLLFCMWCFFLNLLSLGSAHVLQCKVLGYFIIFKSNLTCWLLLFISGKQSLGYTGLACALTKYQLVKRVLIRFLGACPKRSINSRGTIRKCK